MESGFDPSEKYERGLALRKAGLFAHAIEEFEEAASSPGHALKAYAQIGLCNKLNGRHEEAVIAFREALKSSHTSPKQTMQILYMLGRTLEMLGRIEETLEAYRWIRREDPGYRDVEHRLQRLSVTRSSALGTRQTQQSWVQGVLRSCHGLLRTSK